MRQELKMCEENGRRVCFFTSDCSSLSDIEDISLQQ